MMFDNSTDIYTSSTDKRRHRHKRSGSDGMKSSSSHALSSAVSRFISAVDGMNDTIMVPCRLLDMEMNKKDTNKQVPDLLQTVQDPYAIYGLLNSTKNDLIFGLSSNTEEEDAIKRKFPESEKWSSPTTEKLGHSSSSHNNHRHTNNSDRKISSISLVSLGSSTGSCDSGVESDILEEGSNVDSESCLSSEESTVSTVEQASAELRQHLTGLQACLNLLSDTAFFITERYQEELGHD